MGRAVKHAHGRVLPHERLLFQGFASRAADADLSSPCASSVAVRLLSMTAAVAGGTRKQEAAAAEPPRQVGLTLHETPAMGRRDVAAAEASQDELI